MMANYCGLSHLLALFVLALSLTIGENSVEARRILEAVLPKVPELLKSELPHLPDIPNLRRP